MEPHHYEPGAELQVGVRDVGVRGGPGGSVADIEHGLTGAIALVSPFRIAGTDIPVILTAHAAFAAREFCDPTRTTRLGMFCRSLPNLPSPFDPGVNM